MITWTRILAGLNLLGALVSIALLASTWFARGIIVGHARSIALEKTESFMEPVIPAVEKLMNQPLVSRKLPETVRAKLTREIETYRNSPEEWLLAKATAGREQAAEFDFPEVTNPIARKSIDFLTKRLAGAPAHFTRSLDGLITDLRVFSLTNLIVFTIAAVLCFAARTAHWRFWLSAWSAVMLLATVISISLYADQGWVWNILTNHYQGWAYAATHGIITLYLAMKFLPLLRRPESP